MRLLDLMSFLALSHGLSTRQQLVSSRISIFPRDKETHAAIIETVRGK